MARSAGEAFPEHGEASVGFEMNRGAIVAGLIGPLEVGPSAAPASAPVNSSETNTVKAILDFI
jgi:hypothetical protein